MCLEIPASSQMVLHELFGNLIKVFEARGTPQYDKMVELIPAKFKNEYNNLMLMAAVYTVIMFDVRRGREGKLELHLSDFYVSDSEVKTKLNCPNFWVLGIANMNTLWKYQFGFIEQFGTLKFAVF